MAKFNITVELDWVDEDGGIDAVVKEEIINNIANRFSDNLNNEILKTAERKVSEQINKSIDKKVNEITEELLTRKFDLLDNYGDVVEKQTSVIDILKSRLDNFLDEKVDKDGNSHTYSANQTRLNYIINKNIDYTMQRKIEDAAKQVKTGLEKYMDETLKKHIGENVTKIIGIDSIVSKSLK